MIVIRFILRIVLLPVQAILTLLMLAIDFIGAWQILYVGFWEFSL